MSHFVKTLVAKQKTVEDQSSTQKHTYSEAALCCIECMLGEFHRTVERT